MTGWEVSGTDPALHTGGNLRCAPPTDPILS